MYWEIIHFLAEDRHRSLRSGANMKRRAAASKLNLAKDHARTEAQTASNKIC